MKICAVENCEKPVHAKGWCTTHYSRWRKYDDPIELKQVQRHGLTLMERWEGNVAKSDGCWLWVGQRDPNGYGRMMVAAKPELAHRLSWKLLRGDITSKQHVLHRCDNPPCVRPEHLFLGDQVSNNADKMAKKRHRFGVSRGEAHGGAILTADQVREIRASVGPSRIIGEQFAISGRQVREIRARTAWRHIP
jgi:hypothetical protein